MPHKTPVYLFTGFLGAGKTSLFQRILKFPPFDRALIIVNEFGETSIDDVLMVNKNGKAEALAGGCVCCTSRNELLTTVQIALDQETPPSAIVVETTGLASPQPILKALAGNQNLAAQLNLKIVTVIDAMGAMPLLDTQKTAQEQLALADAIVLTKTDLMTDVSQCAAIEPYLHQLNPLANIVHGAEQTDEALAFWLSNQAVPEGDGFVRDTVPMRDNHIGAIQSTTMVLGEAVNPQALEAFLFEASRKLGPSLLRLKGFARLESAEEKRWLVQIVQGVISPPEIVESDISKAQPNLQIVAIAYGDVLMELRLIFDGIFGKGAIDTPDAQALNDNPLSIAGF